MAKTVREPKYFSRFKESSTTLIKDKKKDLTKAKILKTIEYGSKAAKLNRGALRLVLNIAMLSAKPTDIQKYFKDKKINNASEALKGLKGNNDEQSVAGYLFLCHKTLTSLTTKGYKINQLKSVI
ncbi:MAG: hypothetical protein GY810_28130 [Aureispira sp.]|nr:hypothetical protein [Aureispira sp.]